MKIYVVTSGEYSDYGIITATTDLEVAKKVKEKFDDKCSWNETRIETYEDAEEMLKPCWMIRFNKAGEVIGIENESNHSYAYHNLNKCHDYGYLSSELYVYVAHETSEGAIKIAAEKRAKFLAEKNGL